jgi:hypothetical protein
MSDKRKFPRKELKLALIVGRDDQRLPAEMANLTVEGIAFHLDESLEPGTEVRLEISDSESVNENELAARVMRCDPSAINPDFSYLAAVVLTDPNDRYVMDALALVHASDEESSGR